jgi:hypothetical protein
MALIGESSGKNPKSEIQPLPISGLVYNSNAPLASGGQVSTSFFSTNGYSSMFFTFLSDKVGSYIIEYSEDGVNAITQLSTTVQYDSSVVGVRRTGGIDPMASFVRITYTNGTTAQAYFYMTVRLRTSLSQPSLETLGATGAATRLAQWSKSTLHISDANGLFDDVYRVGNALSVTVTNPTPATDITALAKDATITTLNTNIGAKADTAVTDATLSASEIALLKGILSRLSNPLNVVTNPSSTGGYPSKAVYQPSGNAGSFTLVASGVRKLGAINITNTSGSTISIVLYDKSTAPVTSDTPAQMYAVPNGQTFAVELGDGLHFNNGIGIGGIVGTSLSNLLGGILGSAIAAGSVAVSYAYI